MRKPHLLLVAVVLAALAVGVVWIAGGALASPLRANCGRPPADLPCETVNIASGSGATLRGWFVAGKPGCGAVVLMHGVRVNRLAMLGRARFLHRQGYSVLLCDFQSHGESSGERITFGHLESRDAQAEVAYVRRRLPQEKVAALGVSLGGAAALLATPPLQVDALVLESVYPTIDEAISNRLAMRLSPLARLATPLLTLQLRPRIGVSADQLRPIDRIAHVTVPKLIISGTADRQTPITETERLFQGAAAPKELWRVEGAQHQDLHAFATAEYERRIAGFLAAHLR